MGIYHLFPVEGSNVKIAVSVTEKGIMDYMVFIVVGIVALLLAVVMMVWKKRKKKKMRRLEVESNAVK